MPNEFQSMQQAIDRLFYILGALGLWQLLRAVIGYLVRYRVTRGEIDDGDIRKSIKRLWQAHDDCPIDRVETRLGSCEKEIEYIRGRVDQHLNGSG